MIWGYKSGTGTEIWNLPGLPPESIILVHNLEYFTLLKRQTRICARYGRILQGPVIGHRSHIELVKKTARSRWKPRLERIQRELCNRKARSCCDVSQFRMKSRFKNEIKPQTPSATLREGKKWNLIHCEKNWPSTCRSTWQCLHYLYHNYISGCYLYCVGSRYWWQLRGGHEGKERSKGSNKLLSKPLLCVRLLGEMQ